MACVRSIRHLTTRSQSQLVSRSSVSPADHCINLVKQYDYENFLCSLLLPGDARRTAFSVRAFNIEIALVGDKITEHHIGLMRYKWWEDALAGIYSNGSYPKHPVILELSKVIKEGNLLKKQFSRLISARRNSIPKTGFKTMRDMEKYAEESTSPVYYLILQAAGVQDVNADHAASHLGKAQGIVNLVRSIPHHIVRRQCVVPEEILLKHDLPQEIMMSAKQDGSTRAFRDVIYDVASVAKMHLDMARELRDEVPKQAKAVLLPAVAIANYLERLRESDFDVYFSPFTETSMIIGFSLFLSKMLRKY